MAFELPFMEPIHVLGAGSTGLFFASSVRSAFPSYPLAVLFRAHHRGTKRLSSSEDGRKEFFVCTRRNGLLQTRQRPRPQLAKVPYQFMDENRNRKIQNLLLCTKAYQAEAAIHDIQHRLDPLLNIRIFVLCNGALDVREKLSKALQNKIEQERLDLIMCTTTHGIINETISSNVSRNEDVEEDDMFHLLQVGLGETLLGNGKIGSNTVAHLLDQSGLNARSLSNDDMEVILWKKLAANCVCNSLTALWNVSNGQLQENESFTRLRKQIVQEVSMVGTALHPDITKKLSPSALDNFVEQVIQSNFQNKSSMHRDIRLRRSTEINNLNGYVVRKSTELGIGPVPANEELVDRIQEIAADSS